MKEIDLTIITLLHFGCECDCDGLMILLLVTGSAPRGRHGRPAEAAEAGDAPRVRQAAHHVLRGRGA